MEIRPPEAFRHAGELSARHDQPDPRSAYFGESEVDIDLRDCEFIRPPAALWCVVFLALSAKRGARCRLLVPLNMGVCVYLKALGVFQILEELGVEADCRNVASKPDGKIILPLTRFSTAAQATDITNRAFVGLQSSNRTSANLTPVISESFSEVVLNAAEHSESEVGAFACVQFFEFGTGPRFACTVADGGIGIRKGLIKNEKLRNRVSYDWDALELAIRERVSGTGDPHRGIGLYGVSEDVRAPGRSLLLHSGLGSLEISEDMESAARRTRLFPGTLAHLSIPS